MNSQGLPCTLAELSILSNLVSEANFSYMNAPLGDSYREYQQLKNARREYAEMAVKFVEGILDKNQLDSQCKECENVSVDTRILLEKMR